jgi:hypothetical protein
MRSSIRSHAIRTRLLKGGTAILAAVAVVALSTSPAAAAGKPETVVGEYSDESWMCGYPMQVQGDATMRFRERSDPHGSGLPLAVESVKFAETWTNATGASFRVSGTTSSKDLKVASLGGAVYEITTQITGQPQVITADGVVLARDRGNFRFTLRWDFDAGTVDFVGARMSGPHPGFETDICKIVAPVTGTASGERQTPRPLGTTEAPMGYYEYLPPSYGEGGGGSPLLIHTNGHGENGDGSAEALGNLLFTSIPRFIDVGGWPLDRPFVVLSTQHVPQPGDLPGAAACDEVPWPGSCFMQLQHDLGHPPESGCTTPDELHAFISYAIAHYNVDPQRVYVTGLSCGGFGVWEYLAEHGDQQVAAAVPIAGDGRPAWATSGCALGDVPVWAIHGEPDDVVDPAGSIDPITSLRGCPGVKAGSSGGNSRLSSSSGSGSFCTACSAGLVRPFFGRSATSLTIGSSSPPIRDSRRSSCAGEPETITFSKNSPGRKRRQSPLAAFSVALR